MDFQAYIYKEIGIRIRKNREQLGVSQDGYVTRINLDYSADSKKEKSTCLTRERLSNIENGKKQGGRNFLSNSEIEILTKHGFPSRLELLLGTDEEIKKILKSLLFVCLMNNHKLGKIDTEYQLFDISYSKEIEQLSNIIIKIMLSVTEFSQKFSEVFFYYSEHINFKNMEGHNHVGKRKHQFLETTKELETWYSENTGNLIPKLTEHEQSNKIFQDTASKALENVVELLLEDVKEKLNDTLRDLKSYESPNQFQKKAGIINRISLDLFISVLTSVEIYYKLEKYIQKLQVQTETSLQYTSFLHKLEYQKEIIKRLLELESSSPRQYNRYQVESDILSLIDFYNSKQNSTIQTNQPLNLFIDELTFNEP